MKDAIDKRGKLDAEIFTYKLTKDKRVFVFWHGKQLTFLSGESAKAFIAKMEKAEGKAAQLIMAKATGHFKHGNEN